MKKLSVKVRILIGAAVLLTAAAGAFLYVRFASDTRIAFVNYPEYMIAPLLDQEINPAIRAECLKWNDKSGEELRKYDCVIFFGMGLNFTEEQQKLLAGLEVPVYTTASTRKETALARLPEKQREALKNYLDAGGKKNFRRMLDFIRWEVDGKRINASRPLPPEKPEFKPFFHINEGDSFKTLDEYLAWYKSSGRYRENAPLVCILSGNGGGAVEELISAVEKQGMNVFGAQGFWSVLPDLKKNIPDILVYQPHGRLGEEAVAWLKKHNVPLICPIKVNQPYHEYLKDQRGMTGGMLSQSITMPELDGGAVPFVLSALFPNKRGLLEFRTIPDRLERFAIFLRKLARLKRLQNRDKKIALIYYGSIGKESATAGLGISQSVLNLLRRLKAAGYTTGELPENMAELDREIKANTAVFGSNAGMREGNGKLESAHVRTVTITQAEYEAWVKKSMPADLYESVTKRYGSFPGKNFRTEKGDMRIGCIRFGNIILMPQSLPGEGGEEAKLIHGAKMAPPHTYVATYLYLRHGFGADAMMHLGTHGSLEFTPWKQAALSSYDWPDVLVGEMPHYYLYIINNIGEAQIAKRRAYAVMVSHLTPPFMNAESYGYVTELHEKMHQCETADNPKLKAEYAKTIRAIVKKEHIDRDLKLSPAFAKGELAKEDLERIENFLHEITDAKVSRGVYILGRPYTKAEADETARLMTADTIADALFKADADAGKVAEEKRKDKAFFRKNYLARAHERAKQALAHPELFRKKAAPAPKHGKMEPSPEVMERMMKSGKLPDGRDIPPAMMAAMGRMMKSRPQTNPMRRSPAKVVLSPEEITFKARQDLLDSTESEMKAILNAFSGGYLEATSGGDPILNPDTVPTGKNLYGIDPERTPTKESFAVGKELAEALIREKLRTTGKYPRKVGFTLWGGEFIRTQGTNIGEIFFLLGAEPLWDSRGRVQDVRLIPLSQLKRPRIDVIVQTSGQFRGAAASRMRLIDKAVLLAAADPENGEFANYVREGSLAVVKALIAGGMSPEQAKSLSSARIFGGVNGNFGTGVTGTAQNTGKWEDRKVIADLYLNNMGALYTEGHWGEHIPGVFKAALGNTDTVVQSRSSNSWGPLSLDHVYEFTGGLSLAARHVTGKDPGAFFNDLRTPGSARVQEAGEAAMAEARSTVLNPKYIKAMMKEGVPATGTFAEVFRNTLGWEVMKPDMLEDHLWQAYKEVYVDDKLKLNTKEFFEKNNPAALHEMTGIMLEAVRKEFWKTDAGTVRKIAETHAELMKKFDLPPVRNEKLREMIEKQLTDPTLREAYRKQVKKVLDLEKSRAEMRKVRNVTGQKLKAQTPEKQAKGDSGAALKIIGVIIACALAAVIIGGCERGKVK